MHSQVPLTAIAGWSRSLHDQMATGLGYFSIALGLTELFAPRAVSRAAGLDGHETVVQAFGAREVATGIAILTSHDATPWIWGRVAGDAADIATVVAGSQESPHRENTPWALVALAGVTALDVVCALGLTELLAPRAVSRAAGLSGHEAVVQGFGAREIVTGVAILTSHDATPWIWGRVAGDAADIATVVVGG